MFERFDLQTPLPFEVEVESFLPVPVHEVWALVSTLRGVNLELSPWFRMTCPQPDTRLEQLDVRMGQRIFRSWLLLLGLIPVDYDDLTLWQVSPGEGFLEQSPMLSQRHWRHRRTLTPVAGGCRVHDQVGFEPRLLVRPLGGLWRRGVLELFRWRHRQLQRRFGTLTRR